MYGIGPFTSPPPTLVLHVFRVLGEIQLVDLSSHAFLAYLLPIYESLAVSLLQVNICTSSYPLVLEGFLSAATYRTPDSCALEPA